MKTKILKSLSAVLLVSLCISALLVTSYAADKKPDSAQADAKMEIVANNVSYSDSLYILYAISNEGFDRTEHEIKMLFWDKPQEIYSLGTEKYSVTDSGTAKVKGKDCLIFYSNGIAAKEMTDDVFARACVVIDGREYYTDVMKFSVLEYVYAMKEQGNIGNGQIKLFTSMLNYGTDAQNSFGHNTSRPANGTYYKISVIGGKLPDGFKDGRYLENEKVVITPDVPAPGMRFSHWVDEDGIIVSFDKAFEITVGRKSKEYTAVYKDISNVVAQLMLKAEIPYNGTVDDIDLPTAVTFEINGESVTLEVIWDTSDFEASKIGTQNIYAELVDISAYATYGIEPGSIVLEVKTLPFTYELDSSNGEYVVTGYYGDAERVTIPSTYRNIYISRIATRAFNSVTTLKEVIVPNTVKTIDNGAFFYCDNIEKITVPFVGESATSSKRWFGWIFGATSYDIQNGVLPIALKEISLAEGVTVIPGGAFYNCSQIERFDLPEGITAIGDNSFTNCTHLTEFTLPSTLITLYDAFGGCINLKRINVENTDMLFTPNMSAGGSLFKNGADLYCNGKLVTEIVIPSGVTRVNNILWNCRSVKKITVPSSVVEITGYAFYGMSALEEIVFEDPTKITNLGSGTFSYCESLKSMDLSEFTQLRVVGGYLFSGCTALTEVKLPAGVTSIESGAFMSTAIAEIDIPVGIQKISNSCFAHCEKLTRVNIPEGVVEIGSDAFKYCSSLCYVNMPSALTTIGKNAFYNCNKLTVIEIPERVYSIENNAFYGCSNLACVIIKSERLSSIGSDAFNACSKLYEIYNLSDINITAGSADNGCIGKYAKVIHTSLDEEMCISVDEDGLVFYITDEEVVLIGYVGSDEEIVLPIIEENRTYRIDNDAFKYNPNIKKVSIPDCVTDIGANAFYSCYYLTSVTIGNSVTSIGNGAFQQCYKLVEVINHSSLNIIAGSSSNGYVGYYAIEVHTGESKIVNYNDYLFYTYNGVNYLFGYVGDDKDLVLPESYKGENYEINQYAFYEREDIISIIIPNSVTSIGDRAFCYCFGLASVTIGNSVTSIGDYAFCYCDSLTSVTIPDSVTSIGEWAFCYCDSLTSVTIPDSVTSIGYEAFYNCTGLTSVTIPDSVTSIGREAFWGCTSLTSVTIGNNVTSIGCYAFYNCTGLTSVTFRNSDGWMRTNSGSYSGGTAIASENLQNKETAAKYLRSDYANSYWYRTQN